MNEYMVTITFPLEVGEDFFSLVPQQRAQVNELMGKGVVTSYCLSANRQTLWMTVMAATPERAATLLQQMPLYRFMEFDVRELMFHNAPVFAPPRFSVN